MNRGLAHPVFVFCCSFSLLFSSCRIMIPLVIAYDNAIGKFIQFSYDQDDRDTPVLVQMQLDQVPSELEPYQVDFPVNNESVNLSKLPKHLQNIVVIDSTSSGDKKSSQIYFAIVLPLLKAFGTLHVYVPTTSPITISEHASAFGSSSTVVFLAGDTSIHEFVNELPQLPPTTTEDMQIAISAIPTGTGNALANSIGHHGVAHAISRLFVGSVEPLANYEVEFPRGTVDLNLGKPIKSLQSLVVFSWAFHAALVADSDRPEYRELGPARFHKAAQENLAKSQNYQATVKFSHENTPVELSGPHSYLLFTTMTSLEKTFKISPHSNPPSDTTLRIVQFDSISSDQIMEIMMEVYDNCKHVSDSRVVYKSIDSSSSPVAVINVTDKDPAHGRWCVDGRIVKVPEGQINLHCPGYNYHGWNLGVIV